ncbi:MAG: ATP-binding protein [Thermoplasmata archaeon]
MSGGGADRPRAVVSWSSGKDSAFSLHEVRRAGALDVVGLLTTVTETYGRVSMHGVRESILEAQAEAAGLPLYKVAIPSPCPNEVYEQAMGTMLGRLRTDGVSRVVFGDLFLEDVRAYREEKLRGTGVEPVFPLWGRPTRALAEEMIDAGLRATIVALDPRHLPAKFAGRAFDRQLLAEFPDGTDPCGERGEFHTCVTDGPMFSHPIAVRPGPVVVRDGYVFADLELK